MRNPMMRIAGLLFMAAMFSSCFIGGTLAKYSTEIVMTDSVRIARWGVTVSSEGDLFSTSYVTDDTVVTAISSSVAAADDERLVAPGVTKDDLFFSITGSPEVAAQVDIKLDGYDNSEEIKEVFLKAGIYRDYTKVLGYDGTGATVYGAFTLTEDYYPLQWTLKNGDEIIASGKLSDIEAYLETANGTDGLTGSYSPNTDLSKLGTENGNGKYTLTWTWPFEGGNDAADTLLGKLSVDPTLIPTEKYGLDVSYSLSITIVQID